MFRLSGAGTALDEVERIVGRFGFIRETNYGRLFEVRVVADPDNLAFTARALEPHTDNPYRDPAPTLQLLHCIQDSGGGGATFFLDGFALANGFARSIPKISPFSPAVRSRSLMRALPASAIPRARPCFA